MPQGRGTTPSFFASHYRTGDAIRAGDRVLHGGSPGRVLFVLGAPEIPVDWSDFASWLGETHGAGFVLESEALGLVFEAESDEDLTLIDRLGQREDEDGGR